MLCSRYIINVQRQQIDKIIALFNLFTYNFFYITVFLGCKERPLLTRCVYNSFSHSFYIYFYYRIKGNMIQLKIILFGLTIVGAVALAVYNHYNAQEAPQQYRATRQQMAKRRRRSPSPPVSICSEDSSSGQVFQKHAVFSTINIGFCKEQQVTKNFPATCRKYKMHFKITVTFFW